MSFQSASTNMAILTGYGALDRQFRKKLGFTSPSFSDLSFLRDLKMNNKLKPNELSGRSEFYYYERLDHLKANATIVSASNTTVDGTPSVIITLSPQDHYNAGKNSYPIPNNDALFSNQVSGLVVSVNRTTDNAHTVTIKSLTGTTDVQTAAAVGSVVNFVGVSVGEASAQVEMRNPRISKVTNKIKTTRGRYTVTDHAAQNKVEFTTINDQPYIHYLGIAETTERFEMDEEMALLTNNINTATVTDASGREITTTLGLIPNIRTNGTELDYYGDIDLATIQDWFSTIIANYGDGEYLCMNGLKFGFALQNWAVDFAKYDGTYSFFDGSDMAFKHEFKGIKMPGIDIQVYFKNSRVFNHAGTLGNDKLVYQGAGVFIPCGQHMSPVTSEMSPYLQIRYLQPQGSPNEIQGDIKVWETGANAKNGATSDVLEQSVHMASYKALQAENLKKFFVAFAGF